MVTQALLYYDPMGGENMPALSALLNYIGQEHLYKKGEKGVLKVNVCVMSVL